MRMRALMLLAVAASALSACSGEPPPATLPTSPVSATTTATMSAPTSSTPSLTVDAAVNILICRSATKALSETSKYFNEQMAALERAAAKGDQDAVVAAATAIQDRLTQLGKAASVYTTKAVSPQLRAALVEIVVAVTEISSPSYPGTQADIKQKLINLGDAFTKACG
jgi:hypothetical protein